MKIIIVGDGKVGNTLAEHLSKEEHDVTIIDTSDDALRRAAEALDVLCVKGNGASISALRESGVDTADVVIAATSMDEINMVCALTAKRLGGQYTIARVRNVEYARDLGSLQREMGIDLIINPENATAMEISHLLRFPAAANIDTFYRGHVELVGFRVQEDDFLCGQPLSQLDRRVKNLPVLFCAAERGEGCIIPDGAFVPKAGDKLYLVGQPTGISEFFKRLGRYTPKIKDAVIIGGGRISHYLITLLEHMGVKVKLIEKNMERCREISELLPHATVICGDGTDQELLEGESVAGTDAFIALTDRDEDNLIISLYAMQQGIPKVITKSNRQNYAGIAHAVGLDSVISPKLITANQILRVVRGLENSQGSVMKAMYLIGGGHAEAMEFEVNETTHNLGVPLKDLKLKKDVLIAVLVHNRRIIIPEGSSVINSGDTVIVVCRDRSILDINDIYEPSLLDRGGHA